MELSIIIPAYNVDKYIEKLLKSLFHQTLSREKYELIVIDDKSQDHTSKILKKYEHKIDQLIFKKGNTGLGATRNQGMHMAQGKYIMFIDSDDIIPKNALKVMLNQIKKEPEVDIVMGSYKRFNKQRESLCVNENLFKEKKKTTLKETPEMLFELTAWNKIYKKSFLQSINFSWVEHKLYEDLYPNTIALSRAKQIIIIPDVVYMWRVRQTSSSITQNKNTLRNLKDRLDMLKLMQTYLTRSDKQIQDFLEKRAIIDLSYYFHEIDKSPKDSLEYIKTNALPFLNTLDPKNLEHFNGYRQITNKVEKKRYALVKEVLLKRDISQIISENKFTIILKNTSHTEKILKKISPKIQRNMRFIVLGKTQNPIKNVEYKESFGEIYGLINSFIIYDKEFHDLEQINYLDYLISKRFINAIYFNKQKGFIYKEKIATYDNSSFPIFLSTLNKAQSIKDLCESSLNGKNSLLIHSNPLYKYSKPLLKFKDSKIAYTIYKNVK